MKIRYAAVILTVLVIVPSGVAQNAIGTWLGETSGERGLPQRPVKAVINSDGTGTFEVDAVNPLVDLTVDGTRVSFAFRPRIGGRPAGFLFRYEGEVDGETMTLYVSMERDGVEPTQGEDPLVLTRE